jgi:hypothetical protein
MENFLFSKPVAGLRRVFYLVFPNETSFEKPEDVPNYVDEVCHYYLDKGDFKKNEDFV